MNIVTKLFLITLFIPLTAQLCHAQIPEEEPNDSYAEAMEIAINETVICAMDGPYLYDYFKVVLTEWGELTAQLSNNADIPCSMNMYGGVTGGIGGASWDGESTVSRCCLAPGTYWIQMQFCPNTEPQEEYYLEIIFTESDGVSDEEGTNSNGTLATASDNGTLGEEGGQTTVSGLLGYDDHTEGSSSSRDRDDWFSFTTTKRSAMYIDSVAWEFQSCSQTVGSDPEVDIWASASSTIFNLGLNTCLQEGTFYLQMEPPGYEWAQDLCIEYDTYVSWESFPEKDDGSDDFADDSIETANEIEFDESANEITVEGYLGFTMWDPIYDWDEQDYWSFMTTMNGELQVTCVFDEEVTGNLAVVDAEGNTLPGSSYTVNDGVHIWSKDCLAAGNEVFIRPKKNGGTCGAYTLYILQNGYEPADEDFNETIEDATPLEIEVPTDGELGYLLQNLDFDFESDDQDYFKVEGDLAGSFEVVLNIGSNPSFPGLELSMNHIGGDMDQTDYLVFAPSSSYELEGDMHYIFDCPPEQADVYLKIFDTGAWTCGFYEVQVSLFEDLTPYLDPEEPDTVMANGLIQEGVLGLGQYVVVGESTTWVEDDNSDTWLFSHPAASTLRITLDKNVGLEPLECSFNPYSKNGYPLFLEGNLEQDDEDARVWSISCASRDTIMIQVTSGVGCGRYRLEVEAEDAAMSDSSFTESDEEPNNTFEEASQDVSEPEDGMLPIYNGLLGYRTLDNPDVFDYTDVFLLPTDEKGGVTLNLWAEEVAPQLELFVKLQNEDEVIYHPIETCIYTTETNGENEFKTYEYCCLDEGEYFIKITSLNVNGYDCRPYTMSVFTNPVSVTDDEDIEDEMLIGNQKEGTLGFSQHDGFTALEEPIFLNDELDSYSFETEEAGTLKLKVEWTSISDDMSILMDVVHEDFPLFEPTVNVYEDSMVIRKYCVQPSTYTVGLLRQSDSLYSCGQYTFSYEVLIPANESELEPNNTIESATTLQSDTWQDGNIGYGLPHAGGEEDGIDYFKYENDSYGTLHFRLISDVNEGLEDDQLLYSLWFYRFEGEETSFQLFDINVEGSSATYSLPCQSPGTVYLVLTATNLCFGYQIKQIEFEEPIAADTQTIMDNWLDAVQLQEGESHEDLLGYHYWSEQWGSVEPSDKYIINLAEPGDLTLSGNTNSNTSFNIFKVTLDDVYPVAGSTQTGNFEWDINCLTEGIYRVEVYLPLESCTEYSIQYDHSPVEDVLEPNNSTPASIALGAQIEAAVGHTVDEMVDAIDQYQVEIEDSQSVTIFIDASSDVNLELTNPDGSSTQLAGSTIEHEFFNLSAGNLQLDIASTDDCASYSLTVNSTLSVLSDLNGDGVVSIDDLLEFLGGMGCIGSDCVGDFNGDNVVNIFDLLLFLTWFNWPN